MNDAARPQMRLLIGGPNASGKSTLAVSLYYWLRRHEPYVSVALHELDVHSDTHGPLMGLKAWSKRCKRWPFPQEAPFEVIVYADMMFRKDSSAIVIGDLPGRLANPGMPRFMASGTHAIYVGRSFDEYDAWHASFSRAGVRLLFGVASVLDGNPVPSVLNCHRALVVHDLVRQPSPDLAGIGLLGRSIVDAYMAG